MTLPREINKALVTDPKEIQIYELPNKEFKIIALRKIKLQENHTIQQNQENNT